MDPLGADRMRDGSVLRSLSNQRRDTDSKHAVGTTIASVAGERRHVLETLDLFLTERMFRRNEVGDVEAVQRPLRNGDCA